MSQSAIFTTLVGECFGTITATVLSNSAVIGKVITGFVSIMILFIKNYKTY